MAANLSELVAKLEKAGANLAESNHKIGSEVAVVAKETMYAAAAAVRTPTTLTGARSSKQAWGVRAVKVEEGTLVGFWGAPPRWREGGISSHSIVSKHTASLRAGGARLVLHFVNGDGGYATIAKHPGVKARPFWQPTKAAIAKQAEAIQATAAITSLLEAGLGK